MVNAVRSLALYACTLSAFVIYGADMGVFLLIPCLAVVRSSGKGTLASCSSPAQSLLRCTARPALMGHVVKRLVSYSTVMR